MQWRDQILIIVTNRSIHEGTYLPKDFVKSAFVTPTELMETAFTGPDSEGVLMVNMIIRTSSSKATHGNGCE